MGRNIFLFVGLFIGLIFCSKVWAFEQNSSITYEVNTYGDTLNTLSLEDIIRKNKNDFVYADKPNNINFGHRNVTVWVSIKLTSPKLGKDYIMNIENAHLDSITLFYFYKGVVVKEINTGDHYQFDSRSYAYNMFSFTLPDSCDYFIMKVRSQGSLNIPLSVYTTAEYLNYSNSSIFLSSLYFGVLLLALIVNTLLYVRVKESIYIYYVLFLIGNSVVYATDSGLLFQYVWSHFPVVNNFVIVFYGFSIFMLLFSQKILSLDKNAKFLNYIFTLCIYIMLVVAFLNLLGYYHYILKYLVYYFYTIFTLYVIAGVYVYFVKKYKPAFFYMLSWSTYIVFVLIYMLAIDGVIEFNFFTQNAAVFGNISEMILLFLAVIDKMSEYRREKDEANSKASKLLEANRVLLFEQNIRLEQMVKQRTYELEELNGEALARNEALNVSQAQLAMQNEIIHKQNTLLSKKKKKLQQIVKKRTLALENSNTKILNRNKTLEQFGYFTAHNIRGPVSSIMGLINLFRFAKDNEVEQSKIITLLKQSSDRLDGVVKDMITLLDFNKNEVIDCEELSLSSLYLEAKENFTAKLSEKGKDIDFLERLNAGTCLGDPIVVVFVLNQLLDNAYKFRNHNRKLVVEVWQVEENETMCFYMRDNGIGFDVSRFEGDVFGLYKKFHDSNFTGKGLGLYFIKEYMTRMSGSVCIEGVKGTGVTVKLTFAKYQSI